MQYSNTQIFDLNQIERDKWVSEFIINNFLTPGKIVLDVGAGTSPYKHLLSHLKYISHDFGEYLGEKLGGTTDYAKIDIKSDITDIPLSDQSVDYLLCTEVLEHVPYPIQAIKEFSRLLKPNGIACITVPFTSGSHQEPFHFYAGFSLNFFKKMCSDYEFEFIEHYQHGGFLRLMAQEILRMTQVYKLIKNNSNYTSENFDKLISFENELSNELLNLESRIGKNHDLINGFCIGFGVALRKL